MTRREAVEMLMGLPFIQCTCNNPTILCKMCRAITKIREFIEIDQSHPRSPREKGGEMMKNKIIYKRELVIEEHFNPGGSLTYNSCYMRSTNEEKHFYLKKGDKVYIYRKQKRLK